MAEVFENISKEGLLEYDSKKRVNCEGQAMDSAIMKAPLEGK